MGKNWSCISNCNQVALAKHALQHLIDTLCNTHSGLRPDWDDQTKIYKVIISVLKLTHVLLLTRVTRCYTPLVPKGYRSRSNLIHILDAQGIVLLISWG